MPRPKPPPPPPRIPILIREVKNSQQQQQVSLHFLRESWTNTSPYFTLQCTPHSLYLPTILLFKCSPLFLSTLDISASTILLAALYPSQFFQFFSSLLYSSSFHPFWISIFLLFSVLFFLFLIRFFVFSSLFYVNYSLFSTLLYFFFCLFNSSTYILLSILL